MTGLIGWWPLHEKEGDTAYDLSGNGNHGTVNAVTQGVAGVEGLTAFKMGDRADLDERVLNENIEGELTSSIWFRTDEIEDGRSLHRTDTDESYYTLQYSLSQTGDLRFHIRDEDRNRERIITENAVIEEGRWHNVVVVKEGDDAEDLSIYVDGGLVETEITRSQGFSSSSFNANSFYIAEAPQTKTQDLRVYDLALSPSEIRELYRQGSVDLHQKSLSDGTDTGAVSRWKLDGGDGSTAVDSWGTNDGAINGASFTDNSVRNDGNSLRFTDGEIDTRFQFPTEDSPFTMSAWAKFEDLTDLRSVVSSHEGGGVDEGFQIRYDDGDDAIIFATYDSDGNWTYATFSNPEKNVWYNIVGVYNGSNHKIYINGSHEDTLNLSRVATTTHNLFIGQAAGHDEPMIGNIDDVRIYDRALESWEVFELYRWGSLGKDLRKELVNKKGNGGVQ